MLKISINSQQEVWSGEIFSYQKTLRYITRSINNYSYNNEYFRVLRDSPAANVQLYYSADPIDKNHYSHQYKIFMNQAETDLLSPRKAEIYASGDEIWTANYLGKKAMVNAGLPGDKVFVYEHGVDSKIYRPKLRGTKNIIKFLHIDAGAGRKRADLSVKAFKKLYANNEKYSLTLKFYGKEKRLEVIDKNIFAIYGNFSENDMNNLFQDHDILLHPSEGEGFGLVPLEAMATGMPVISTAGWCSYSSFLNKNIIKSKIGPSKTDWGYPKFGNAENPDLDSLIHLMENNVENIEEYSGLFFNQSQKIAEKYNWNVQTKIIMDNLVGRIGPSCFR